MDITVRNGDRPSLTYKTIGGILDFKIILGKDPNDVINAFHEYIGAYVMQPFWSFGFH